MKDRLSKYPGRVKLTPVDGQANTFDMIRADEPENEGTPLNKNTFLTDETAVELGLDPASDPTPNDALAALMERMLADGNGIMQKMMQMPKGDSNVGIMNGENKKIFGYGTDGKFYTGDPEYPLTFRGSAENPTYNTFDMLKVQTGTYKGTGKSGTSGKNKITFTFTPKIVFVYEKSPLNDNWSCRYMIALYGMTAGTSISPQDNISNVQAAVYGNGMKFTWAAKSLTWWHPHDSSNSYAANQLNTSGKTYNWIAIG